NRKRSGELLEGQPEDVFEGSGGVGTDIAHGQRARQLPRHGRERRVLEAAGGDPARERRWVEIDVERVSVGCHPARDVDADRRDLAWRPGQPDPCETLDVFALDTEGGDGADQRLLEVADVALDVSPV